MTHDVSPDVDFENTSKRTGGARRWRDPDGSAANSDQLWRGGNRAMLDG
jgi:hypothetical protein